MIGLNEADRTRPLSLSIKLAEMLPRTGLLRSGGLADLWHLPARNPLLHGAAASAFVASAAGSALAQSSGRPITAAIIFLLGVIVAGAVEGVWGGLLAALAASIFYNFFLIEPTFRFSLATLEDYVPILAFNAGAVAAGILTGRLKDRALAAERATWRVSSLLALSERLQSAVDLPQVLEAVRAFVGPSDMLVELYALSDSELEPVGGSGVHSGFAAKLLAASMPRLRERNCSGFLLTSASETLGGLVFEWNETAEQGPADEDLAALVNLASIAMERCLLLRRLSQAELIRKSEEFKTALLSSVSHDMRTPLSAISAAATGLASYGPDLPETARADLLSTIQEQCGRLNTYTTKLLSLGRLQAGLDRERFMPCDAIEVLGSAIVQARTLGGDHSIVKEIGPAEALVRADPVMLEQVFYNLLENSVRYSDPGLPIIVTAKTRTGRLLVSVRDFGQGVPPCEFRHIFERFYRSRESKGHEGSGLGLAIAKGFTEAFSGRIWAAPPPDGLAGTIFTVELPLVEPREPAP